MSVNREKIRMLILLSQDVEEADSVISGQSLTTVREKIAFLSGMFDFTLLGRKNRKNADDDSSERMDYYAILATIINSRWEG